tara:strand:+ start:4682 stop:5242 length:561 start_codon:yes stop_codon:yes gene_type:complete
MVFEKVSYEAASEEVKAIYDETMKEMNIPFVLNWFKCQGNNAELLRGNWEKLKSVMLRGSIPMILKQLIIYNISKERGCEYCAQAHGVMADSMSSALNDNPDFRVTENMDSTSIPPSYKAAIRIITNSALNPASTSEDDFEALQDEGFSDDEIQELFAHADLVNMLNTVADISGIKLDNELMEAQM